MERCLFSARIGISSLYLKWLKCFFSTCALTWRVNNYVSRQRNGVNKRIESTNNVIKVRDQFATSTINWLNRLWIVFYLKFTFFRYSPKLIKKIQLIRSSLLMSIIPFKRWERKKTSENWQLFQGKHKNILGTASHGTRPFLELLRITSHRFLRRLKAGSLKKCPRSSPRQSPLSWELCLN